MYINLVAAHNKRPTATTISFRRPEHILATSASIVELCEVTTVTYGGGVRRDTIEWPAGRSRRVRNPSSAVVHQQARRRAMRRWGRNRKESGSSSSEQPRWADSSNIRTGTSLGRLFIRGEKPRIQTIQRYSMYLRHIVVENKLLDDLRLRRRSWRGCSEGGEVIDLVSWYQRWFVDTLRVRATSIGKSVNICRVRSRNLLNTRQ